MKSYLFVLFFLFCVIPAKADTIYTYTGGTVSHLFSSGETTGLSIDGDFVLAGGPIPVCQGPLGALCPGGQGNFGEDIVVPLTYSFTDGFETLNQNNSTGKFAIASLCPGGCVYDWTVNIQSLSGYIFSNNFGSLEATDSSPSVYVEGGFGSWTVIDPVTSTGSDPVTSTVVTNTPEPGSMLLSLVGMAGVLGLALWRR